MSLAGHLWTIAPNLRHRLAPRRAPDAEAWSTEVLDPKVGRVRISGRLRRREGSDALCVVIHGLGGSVDSQYMIRAAAAVEAAGLACLRLSLRGADRQGDDFYHAGLTDDVKAALQSPALAEYRRVFLLGYSLGGHLSLRCALDPIGHADARVRAVASVCAPLDLAASGEAIDTAAPRIYRAHILAGLREIYNEVARRRDVPSPVERVARVTTIRAWDEHTVVPRFGFANVDAYYEQISVGPALRDLTIPALIVSTVSDPMIPPRTLWPSLRGLPAHVETRWIAGGHVGYSSATDLGIAARGNVEDQLLAWLTRH
ncbi:MAG: alpha/beta fold hydrolase [Myxococcales bacterium]|nr:alpha/beta fold hydrolase [Myxococcales bacterium]